MALVAYSDESDFSDDDDDCNSISRPISLAVSHNKSNNKTTNGPNLLQSGISSIIDEDELQTNGFSNASLPSNIVENADEKHISFPSSSVLLENERMLELNEHDIVDDVPTVNTWTITKNLKNFDKSIQQSLEPIKIKKTKNKLQFILPSLAELQDEISDDDHDDDLEMAKKKYKPSSTGTGLFAVLPKPKNTTSSLVPNSVSRARITKKISKPKTPLTKTKHTLIDKNEDSDEGLETVDDEDFFSLNKPAEIIEPLPLHAFEVDSINSNKVGLSQEKNIFEENESNSVHSIPNSSEEIISESVSSIPLSYVPQSTSSVEIIDEDALLRLRGRRNREAVNVIDINADDALMSRHEWMTRSMSETKPTKSFSKKKDGNPTQLQRRKHQITYLAHQAQEREQDLQNTWGQNRFTKMQTQSKYGF